MGIGDGLLRSLSVLFSSAPTLKDGGTHRHPSLGWAELGCCRAGSGCRVCGVIVGLCFPPGDGV